MSKGYDYPASLTYRAPRGHLHSTCGLDFSEQECSSLSLKSVHCAQPRLLHDRQSEDLAYTLREAGTSGSMHIFVVEDDQMLCHNGLLSLQYLIRKAYSYAPGWLAMRTSVGFNGIVLKTQGGIP
jgi:hypothetical protein